MRIKLAGLLIILNLFMAWAQIPVGDWRTHYAIQNYTEVQETPSFVYAIADGHLFEYDKTNGAKKELTKLNHLSDNDPAKLCYSQSHELLVIAYTNGNIDIFDGEETYNIPDLRNKIIATSKTPNSIYTTENSLYICYPFGVLKINLSKKEIIETYYMNGSNGITHKGEKLYLATDNGIFAGNSNANLLDKNNWKKIHNYAASHIVTQQDRIITLAKTASLTTPFRLYLFTEATEIWSNFDTWPWQWLSVWGNRIVVGDKGNNLAIFLTPGKQRFTKAIGTNFSSVNSLDGSTLWGVHSNGVVRKIQIANEATQPSYAIETPTFERSPLAYNSSIMMRSIENKVFIACGGRDFNNFSIPATYMVLENEQWKSITVAKDNALATGMRAVDLMSINEDPSEKGCYYATTWCDGVYEFKNNEIVKVHHNENTDGAITDIFSKKGYMRMDGGEFDKQGNYWITNSQVNKGICMMSKDKKWKSFYFADIAGKSQLAKILPTTHGSKWVISKLLPENDGLFVFNENGTYDNASDDNYRFFKTFVDQDNKIISPTEYYDVIEDQKGTLWIATSHGPLQITSPKRVFDSDFYCVRPKISRNDGSNLADYLLENVPITCIAVDGGNRKWFGTETSGIYLTNESGTEIITQFNTDNTILPSNKITAITVNPVTGELFIGTNKGIVSFRADATEGKKTYNNVYAFPNPVRPDYQGTISITGLRTNSVIKITDINGNIIVEGTSIGGQYSWNGQNKGGKKVQTGVYLVWGALSDASEGVVTKILFVN